MDQLLKSWGFWDFYLHLLNQCYDGKANSEGTKMWTPAQSSIPSDSVLCSWVIMSPLLLLHYN